MREFKFRGKTNYVCFREGHTYPTFEQWKCDKDKAMSFLNRKGVKNND